MNKKPFKPVFNNPLRKNAVPPEREMPSRKLGDWTQVQVTEKAVAPVQPKKSNIKKTATDNSRKPEKNLKKKQNKENTMVFRKASINDAEYDEIFSLAIHRAMTAGIPSPDALSSDTENEMEDRVAIPKANEALPPQESAAGPTEYSGKQVQAEEQTFTQTETAETHNNASDCTSEITRAEDSLKAKIWITEDVQRAAKRIPPSTGTSNLLPLRARPKKQETLKLQDKKQKRDKEGKKQSDTSQNFKPASKDAGNVPNIKKRRSKQPSKLLDNSSSQKPALAKHNEPALKESSQFSQSGCLHSHTCSHSKQSTQCSHHSQKCGHVCNKDSQNNSNVVQESNTPQCSVVHKSASQSQYSQTILSQPGPELSLKERLLWLRNRRDIGLWVQCCHPTCNKWRYLHDIHDPVDVPQEWFCNMNSDKKHNSCGAPEKPPTSLEEEDLIHNMYTAGSLVWGRLAGYPWWPAIVDDDPDTEQYYWLSSFSDIPTHYNVVFFDEKEVTRAWLTPGAMVPFTGHESSKEFRTTIARGVNYAKRLQAAKQQAQKALPMAIGERLRTFGFLARYNGPIGHIQRKNQNKRKPAEDEDTSSQDSDKDEAVAAYRNLQKDGGNKKRNRKRAKPDRISKRTTKKTKVQSAVSEKRAGMSEATDNISKRTTKKTKVQAAISEKQAGIYEATDNISKINSNKVEEHDPSSTPHQITFNSSLYTQELSNNETDKPNNKLVTETSSATNPEHATPPESTQSFENNGEPETINGMEIPSDNDKIQINATATLDETIINCSQDLFTSQTATAEQNMSEKCRADTATGISWIDFGSNKLSTSSETSSRIVNNLENKNAEFTADSCMATVGEKTDSEEMQTEDCTDGAVDVTADKNGAEDGAANDEDSHKILTEVESSVSVLQSDTQNPSTSYAATGSQLDSSGTTPRVPDIQHNDFHVNANQNCDAVVPQLDDDRFGDNSNDSLDFDPEE